MTARPDRSLLEPAILRASLLDALRKLDPRAMVRNPVMFVVELGAVLVTIVWIGGSGEDPGWYTLTVAIWLWLTVIFGNFAEAIAEGRGRAQAASLRAMRRETTARLRDGGTKSAGELRPATSWSSRRGRRSPATARSSRGSRPSTSRRSPASPRR